MPLNAKGKKIMKNLVKEYGAKKGKTIFYAMYNWTLTGTVTPTVAGWAGGTWGSSWWVWWNWLSLIEANTVFA